MARASRLVSWAPDNLWSQADRQQAAYCYRGILAAAASALIGRVLIVPFRVRVADKDGRSRIFIVPFGPRSIE